MLIGYLFFCKRQFAAAIFVCISSGITPSLIQEILSFCNYCVLARVKINGNILLLLISVVSYIRTGLETHCMLGPSMPSYRSLLFQFCSQHGSHSLLNWQWGPYKNGLQSRHLPEYMQRARTSFWFPHDKGQCNYHDDFSQKKWKGMWTTTGMPHPLTYR